MAVSLPSREVWIEMRKWMLYTQTQMVTSFAGSVD